MRTFPHKHPTTEIRRNVALLTIAVGALWVAWHPITLAANPNDTSIGVQVVGLVSSSSSSVSIITLPGETGNQTPGAYRYSRSYTAALIESLLRKKFGTSSSAANSSGTSAQASSEISSLAGASSSSVSSAEHQASSAPQTHVTFDTVGSIAAPDVVSESPGYCDVLACQEFIGICFERAISCDLGTLKNGLLSSLSFPKVAFLRSLNRSEFFLWVLFLLAVYFFIRGIVHLVRRLRKHSKIILPHARRSRPKFRWRKHQRQA